MSKRIKFIASLIAAGLIGIFLIFSPPEKMPPHILVPTFPENLAYQWILEYERFGPKIPGTDAHRKAGDWIVRTLKEQGLVVHEQIGTAVTFQKNEIPIRNIIARWNPDRKKRILLSAHWDNRPFADQDANFPKQAVPGVNDGGSGTVVLFGIAHSLSQVTAEDQVQIPFGIDFAFWDAEDWGTPSIPNSYALGSQYWAKNPIPKDYRAEFGVNFDMVGHKNAIFPIDVYSMKVAPKIIEALHDAGRQLGYGDRFSTIKIGPVVDDHFFVAEATGIPMIDIIHMHPEDGFAPQWHTIEDTSEHISRAVLKVVGQSTLQMIWNLNR